MEEAPGQTAHGITNGELARAVILIRDDIKDLKKDVENKPSTRDIEYLTARISDLEEWQKWGARFGIPALLAIAYNTLTNIDRLVP